MDDDTAVVEFLDDRLDQTKPYQRQVCRADGGGAFLGHNPVILTDYGEDMGLKLRLLCVLDKNLVRPRRNCKERH